VTYNPDGTPQWFRANGFNEYFYKTYNDLGLLTVYQEFKVIGGVTSETDLSYDLQGNLTEISKQDLQNSGNNSDWQFTYDGNRNRLTMKYLNNLAGASYTAYVSYDLDNRPTGLMDFRGNYTSVTYDAFSRPTTVTPPPQSGPPGLGQPVWQLSYGSINNQSVPSPVDSPTMITDPANLATTLEWDDFKRLVRVDSPDSGQWTQVYNGLNLPTETVANGIEADYTYDAHGMGRLTQINFELSAQNGQGAAQGAYSFAYGANTPCAGSAGCNYDVGRLNDETITDAQGSVTYQATHGYAYDGRPGWDQVTIDGLPSAAALTYSYDNNRQLSSVVYPSGNVVTYTSSPYFEHVSQVAVKDVVASGGAATYTLMANAAYTPRGNLSSYDHGNGVTTKNTYVNDQFLASKVATGAATFDLTLTPDENLNVATMISKSDNWSVAFGYDALNQLLSAEVVQGGATMYPSLVYQYDANGKGLRQSETRGTTQTYTYTYQDPFSSNKLAKVTDSAGNLVRQYQYDSYGRVGNMAWNNGAAALTYNFQGMIDTATVTGPGVSNPGTYTYAYDTKNRRVKKTAPDGSAVFYGYDAFDNLVAEYAQAVGHSPALAREYYYANGVLIGLADIVQTQSNSNPFGCSSSMKKSRGRLAKSSSPLEVAWLFLPLGGALLSSRWRRYDQRGKVRLVVAAGVAFASGLILLAAAGRSHASGTTTVTTYTPYWVHTDNIGAPIKLTDENGAVVWTALYEPFGAIASGTPAEQSVNASAPVLNIRRPGQYYDAETGLYYNGHRYYDPVSGSYLQPDQFTLSGKARIPFLPYAYVGNNPLIRIDYRGEDWLGYFDGTTLTVYIWNPNSDSGVSQATWEAHSGAPSTNFSTSREGGQADRGQQLPNGDYPGRGPIPEGLWKVTNIWPNPDKDGGHAVNSYGSVRLEMKSILGDTYDRTGILTHGGGSRYSHGCIKITDGTVGENDQIAGFVHTITFWGGPGHIIVIYPNTGPNPNPYGR
jgi:RHS repeat-associated protein